MPEEIFVGLAYGLTSLLLLLLWGASIYQRAQTRKALRAQEHGVAP